MPCWLIAGSAGLLSRDLAELGVPYLMRETYLSSLDMAEHVLEWLGDDPATALIR